MSVVVLASWIGEAAGSRAAAAALACAGSAPDSAGLLLDLAPGRAPRPALVATVAARRLEERLAVHLPQAHLASRGQICHLALPANLDGLEQVPAGLALARESVGVVHLPPELLQPLLEMREARPSAALLRADLGRDPALTALAVRDLIEKGLRVGVLKRPLAWVASRRALFGMPATSPAAGLPPRLVHRLLTPAGIDDAQGFLDALPH